MKKLLATTAILATLLTPSVTYASHSFNLECGMINISPRDNDPNPTISIRFSVAGMPNEHISTWDFETLHRPVRGEPYRRSEQYYNIRLAETRNGVRWTGTWRRNSSVIMEGIAYEDRSGRFFYEERVFRNGRLTTTIRSICSSIPHGGE